MENVITWQCEKDGETGITKERKKSLQGREIERIRQQTEKKKETDESPYALDVKHRANKIKLLLADKVMLNVTIFTRYD